MIGRNVIFVGVSETTYDKSSRISPGSSSCRSVIESMGLSVTIRQRGSTITCTDLHDLLTDSAEHANSNTHQVGMFHCCSGMPRLDAG